MSKCSTIVLFSGGIDSTLCGLIAAREEKPGFVALSVDYGQNRHELDAAVKLAEHYKWPLSRVAVTPFPASLDPAGANLILGRNAMFLSLAAAMLDWSRPGRIYIGANADDHHDYPDCRVEFFSAWEVFYLKQGASLTVQCPLINLSKRQVVQEAKRRGVPLGFTVSCYVGRACGECNACRIAGLGLNPDDWQ